MHVFRIAIMLRGVVDQSPLLSRRHRLSVREPR
jgi:hypothetical protein